MVSGLKETFSTEDKRGRGIQADKTTGVCWLSPTLRFRGGEVGGYARTNTASR